MDNLLHIRAMKEFGRGYLSPRKSEEVLRALFARIDKAESLVAELERLMSISCCEIFDGIVMRPHQIEEIRAWHSDHMLDHSGEGPAL